MPECVAAGAESKENYELALEKARVLLASAVETDRERRWKLAEERLAVATMCSPNSSFRKRWDVAQIFLLLYVALFVPYRIGFSQDTEPGQALFFFDVLVDFFFMCDIILSFRTGYVDSRGELQYRIHAIAGNYLRTWMIIDIASCMPVNYVAYIPGVEMSDANARSNKMLRLLRLLRLLKLLRLLRVNRIIARYEQQFHAIVTSMKLAKLAMMLLMLGHWLGCAWYYVGDIETNDVDRNGKPLVGWVKTFFSDKSANRAYFDRYCVAMYWSIMTMTTVGYGDIGATTLSEILCALFGMMIGGFVFGTIVGNLSEVSRRANPSKSLQAKRLGLLRAFLQEREVTQLLTTRITSWYAYHLKARTAMETQSLLLDLPARHLALCHNDRTHFDR